MVAGRPMIAIVDDEETVRRALQKDDHKAMRAVESRVPEAMA